MRILGIDQSLSHFAVAIFDDDKLIYQDEFKPRSRGAERLASIRMYLETLKTDYKPETICFEGYAFGAKGRGIFSLGELGGLLRIWCYDNAFVPIIIQPTALKKFVCGKGNAPKDIVLKEVFRKWQYDTSSNNLADAYSLGRFAYMITKYEKDGGYGFTKADIDCIKRALKIEDETEEKE